MRLKNYLAGFATNSQALSRFEPGALRSIGRLHRDMPTHVKQAFNARPSLALLEYLGSQPSTIPKITDPRRASLLAQQIPQYAKNARRPSQELTVMRSLDMLAQYAASSGQTEPLEQALTGLSGWSPALRQSIVQRIPPQLTGIEKARGLCHALQGTKPEASDQETFFANLSRFQTDPRIQTLLASKPSWQIATSVSPTPGNSLGNQLIRSALVCVLGAPISQQEKLKYLNQAAQETARLDPTGKNCPVSLRNLISGSKPEDLKGKIQQAVEKFSSGWSKLVTPKKMLKKQRDYLLVRDKEGNILAHQVTTSETESKEGKKQEPKIGLAPPTTLAKPVPGMPGQLEFNTSDLDMKELAAEISLPDSPAVPNLPGNPPSKPTRTLKPSAKNKILPSSSISGFTESLNHEVNLERHTEDCDVLIY